jgi:hypothetical protein
MLVTNAVLQIFSEGEIMMKFVAFMEPEGSQNQLVYMILSQLNPLNTITSYIYEK